MEISDYLKERLSKTNATNINSGVINSHIQEIRFNLKKKYLINCIGTENNYCGSISLEGRNIKDTRQSNFRGLTDEDLYKHIEDYILKINPTNPLILLKNQTTNPNN